MTSEEKRTHDSMTRTARRMLERTENRKELAKALYQYNAKALVGGGGALLPGDVCCGVPEGLVTSRGAAIPMSLEELSALVDGGALDRMFRMDDLNAPDFGKRIDAVMSKIDTQRHFHDASCYYRSDGPGLEAAVAVYDIPAGAHGGPQTISVERSDAGMAAREGVRDDLGTGFRQCTYEEFNPGGKALALEAGSVNTERESKANAYDRLKEDYLSGGQHEGAEAGEVRKPMEAAQSIPGYDAMSATEKLAAMRDATDQYADHQARVAEEDARKAAEEEWVPGSKRRPM